MSDGQVEAELGRRVKRLRVERGLNQTELGERAGVGRRTISGMENGEGCTMGTFIALVRALGEVGQLEGLFPEPEVSPLVLTETAKLKERKYPYKPRKKKDDEWKWGDEK